MHLTVQQCKDPDHRGYLCDWSRSDSLLGLATTRFCGICFRVNELAKPSTASGAGEGCIRCIQIAGMMSSYAEVGIQLLGRHVDPLLNCVRLRSHFNHAHHGCFAGPAFRSGCTKCLTVDAAWPLFKDCLTSNMSGKPQVGLVASEHLLSDFQEHLKASFCAAAEFPSLPHTCQTLPEPPAAGPAGPDISLLTAKLQKQWHHNKNQHLGDTQIKPGSQRRVWWTCYQCPCRLSHEWLATVKDRQGMDTQCPFCTNRKLCHHNSLLTVAPSVASYWDSAKNGITADQVVAGSGTRKHWMCPTCNHSWQAWVQNKSKTNSGCPKCSKNLGGAHQTANLDSQQAPCDAGV